MSLAESRSSLMGYLKDNVQANIYDVVPQTVMSPAVFIFPDDPYLEPRTIGNQVRFIQRLRIVAAVSMLDNRAALANLEDLLVEVTRNLPQGITLSSWDRPSVDTVGPSDLLVSTMTLEVPTTQE